MNLLSERKPKGRSWSDGAGLRVARPERRAGALVTAARAEGRRLLLSQGRHAEPSLSRIVRGATVGAAACAPACRALRSSAPRPRDRASSIEAALTRLA